MESMTHLSLFSGIGGLDIAAEWAGFETVGQCEWADYPTKVLEKHWPTVPRWRDIRTLTKESFYERTGLRTVDIISGGFPCQPFSTAGVRRGKKDDRYLWPEMLRVIEELRPSWVIGENVVGIIDMALDTVLSDLEAIGYSVQAFVVPACGVDAPHRRYRVFIVAYSNGNGRKGPRQAPKEGYDANQIMPFVAEGSPLPNAESQNSRGERRTSRGGRSKPGRIGWWSPEPDVGRVANGVSDWVDRLKSLGNAVVPQQAYPIFRAIYEIEENIRLEATNG